MKLKTLFASALIALSLTACNDQTDFTGTYQSADKLLLDISKDGKKYIVKAHIILKTQYGEKEVSSKVVTYEKENNFYNISDDSLVGKFEKDSFTLSKNGLTYKKKL